MATTLRHRQETHGPAEAGLAPRRRLGTSWSGMHSSRVRLHFRERSFDFFLQWLAGAQTSRASEIGETLYAASRIKDADVGDWEREWDALAVRVEASAWKSLRAGHRVSAREAFLRAYTYHRAPLALMSPLERPREYRDHYEKARVCFREAAILFDPPIETVAIPFEGASLPGYFLTPSRDQWRRKTLVMIGGGETFCEDLYAYIGPAGVERGYNVLLVDLPEQGITPAVGMVARPDTEAPMSAVMDFLLGRPQVDPERVAVFGISGGGYLAPRAAMFERRIGALVALSMILDGQELWTGIMGTRVLASLERLGLLRLASHFSGRFETARVLFDTYKWRTGSRSIGEMMERAKPFVVDPARIACPTLILVAEQEYEGVPVSRRWQDEALAKVGNPRKSLVVLKTEDGAGSHAGGTNLSLVAQLVFDWLDETFAAI
ncbi:MAG: alpha/beta hydrolase [Actinomycetota bacterium]|nr:alpha/beta hydrolase [Actinomycetota bacterium]